MVGKLPPDHTNVLKIIDTMQGFCRQRKLNLTMHGVFSVVWELVLVLAQMPKQYFYFETSVQPETWACIWHLCVVNSTQLLSLSSSWNFCDWLTLQKAVGPNISSSSSSPPVWPRLILFYELKWTKPWFSLIWTKTTSSGSLTGRSMTSY